MFRRHHHHADGIEFFYSSEFFRFSKEGQLMLVALTPGQVAKAVISPTAQGKPSTATLSSPSFTSSDTSVFTVEDDPAVTNGCIITGVGNGAATRASINATATATEVDGRVDQVSGSDDVSCELLPPPVAAADGLVFTLTPSVPVAPPIPVP
jgi:hypothetical protein